MKTNKKRRLILGGLSLAAAGWLVYRFWFGPRHRRWGAAPEEILRKMPGDELVESPDFNTTRALDIAAPAGCVWPWLAQMGQGRGGFYSYDVLENLMGLNIHSAGKILPAYQGIRPGDKIPLEPEGGGFEVVQVEPERLLVLYAGNRGETGVERYFQAAGIRSTWVFSIEPRGERHSRLVIRWRARFPYRRSLDPQSWAIGLGLDLVEFLMERKMMLGIRRRAEGLAANRSHAFSPDL